MLIARERHLVADDDEDCDNELPAGSVSVRGRRIALETASLFALNSWGWVKN